MITTAEQKTYTDFGILGITEQGKDEQSVLCPQCSHTRKPEHRRVKCLYVNIRKRTWYCHNCGWAGGLPKRPFIAVQRTPGQTPGKLSYNWFANRGISHSVVKRNKIEIQSGSSPVFMFPFYVGDAVVNVKHRTPDKRFWQIAGGEAVLYKLNDLEGQTEAIICEGEIDALSFEMAGFRNAVSVPDGAPTPEARDLTQKFRFLENCEEYISHITRWYIAADADAPGAKLRDELARRFGKNICSVITYPDDCKDANDVLMKHGAEALRLCVELAKPYPIDGVASPESRYDYLDDLYEYGFPPGATTRIRTIDEHIKFYPSHLTVITGIPSSGKSVLMDNIMVRLAQYENWRFGVFTPENFPFEVHMQRLASIIVEKPFLPDYNGRMDRHDYDVAKAFIADRFHYIYQEDHVFSPDEIIECARYLVRAKGIHALVIDPWNKMLHESSKQETAHQYTGRVLTKLQMFARSAGIHLFIVAHPTKMTMHRDGVNFTRPTLYSISDSAHWYNMPDNGIVMYRQKDANNPDFSESFAVVEKVKHEFIGKTGICRLNFDKSCFVFREPGAPYKYPQSPRNNPPTHPENSDDGYTGDAIEW